MQTQSFFDAFFEENAEIFGIEPLSLNRHFAHLKRANDPIPESVTLEHTESLSQQQLHIPQMLEQDLLLVTNMLDLDTLQVRQQAGFELSQCSLTICCNGLTGNEKKQLWSVLSQANKEHI